MIVAAALLTLMPAQDAEAPPAILVTPTREATPESLTEPSRVFDCELVDEAFGRVKVRLSANGARGYWLHRRDGTTAALRADSSYSLESADPRFSGWKYNRTNLHDIRGVNFTREDGIDAVVQYDGDVALKGFAINISFYVQQKPQDRDFKRYVGFCRTTQVAQQPLPDRYEGTSSNP